MAVACAKCGTQNPEGNQFCQNCGTPLAAAAPSAAPPAPAPPAPAPMAPPPAVAAAPPPAPGAPPPGYAYQNPYYQPGAGAPPVHRTPWVMIVGAVVGVVVILAGVGIVIAAASFKPTNQVKPFAP